MREVVTMNRCGWLVMCILVFAALPAFGRSWTYTSRQSNDKETIEGDFLRIVGGRAIIVSGGQYYQIPFGRLAQEDQDFVRQLLEAQGRANELPPKRPTSPSSQPSSADKNKPAQRKAPQAPPITVVNAAFGEERTWTDKKGHKTMASLAGMDKGQVVLQNKEGDKKSFPYDEFSVEDQEYVRKTMVAHGEGYKVPPRATPVRTAPAGTPPVRPAPARTAPVIVQSAAPQAAIAQATVMPPLAESPNQTQARKSFPWWYKTKSELSNAARSVESAPAGQVSNTAEGQAAKQIANVRGRAPSSPPSRWAAVPKGATAMETPAAAAPVQRRICSNCKVELPDSCKPGDNCPHCGAYLNYEDTADHVRVAGPFRFSIVGIPAAMACLLYAAAVGIVRLQWEPRKKRG